MRSRRWAEYLHVFISNGLIITSARQEASAHSSCLGMAHRILWNVVVTGTQVFSRAFVEAYKQATSASVKASAQAARQKNVGGLSLDEARKILGVESGPLDPVQVRKKYEFLFDANSKEKSGSFYLQSKVFRAMERINAENTIADKGARSSPS